MGGVSAAAIDPFNCPRCGQEVSERFYGPCTTCRNSLRDLYRAEAKVVELADYVPKMNVTPNAVALKDD
jgi:cytidine deaminase